MNAFPLHLRPFVLSNSKRLLNIIIHAINGFFTIDLYYTDTNSLYKENKNWDKLDKAGLVDKTLLQGKNEYKEGGIFYSLFLAPKIKHCLIVNKYGVLDQHKFFKVFHKYS